MAAAEDDMPVLGLGLCHGLDGRHLSVLGHDYGLPGFCQIMTPTPNEDGMEMRSKNEGGLASFLLFLSKNQVMQALSFRSSVGQ